MYYFMLSCVVKTLFLKKEKKIKKKKNYLERLEERSKVIQVSLAMPIVIVMKSKLTFIQFRNACLHILSLLHISKILEKYLRKEFIFSKVFLISCDFLVFIRHSKSRYFLQITLPISHITLS